MADLYNLEAEIAEADLLGIDDPQENQAAAGDAEDWDATHAEPVNVVPQQNATEQEDEAQQDERIDLDAFGQTMADNLMYASLYHAWTQERQSPDILPFPTEIVDAMRQEIADQDEVDTGNPNLNGLLESILFIDKERVKFLLADLLKTRLEKIQTHPIWMESKTERMSPHELNFWTKYKDLKRTHILTNVMLPNKEDWRKLESDEPELSHVFCFAELRESVDIKDTTMGEGARTIVRFEHVRQHIEEGKAVLV